jgi:ABC-2 type transport system permease protein
MTRLVHVELRRLFGRRLFRLLLAGVFLTLLVVLVVNGVRSNRNFAAARARAAQRAAAFASPPPPLVSLCAGKAITTPAPSGGPGPIKSGANPCIYQAPTAQDFYSDPRFSFAANAANLVITAVAMTALVGFVVGAGFVGAEWGAGTFTLLLTWEPRRLRVLSAKLLAVVVTFVAAALVATALAVGGAWLVAATRGTTAGTVAGVWHSVVYSGLRGLALVALLSAVGVCVAGLTRHTAAVLVGAIGYMIVFEFVVRRLHPEWSRWLLASNAGALLGGRISLPLVHRGPGVAFFGQPTVFVLHAGRAAIYLCALCAVALVAWAVTLVRRDVDEGGR